MDYKEIVYKKKLLDTILEQRDLMSITKINDEINIIYDVYSNNKQVPVKDNAYLELSMNSAVISYKIYPYMNINNRISFINGINYATEFLKRNENNVEFHDMSLENRVDLAIKTYDEHSMNNELDIKLGINSKEVHYFKKGIKSYIGLIYINDHKMKR